MAKRRDNPERPDERDKKDQIDDMADLLYEDLYDDSDDDDDRWAQERRDAGLRQHRSQGHNRHPEWEQ